MVLFFLTYQNLLILKTYSKISTGDHVRQMLKLKVEKIAKQGKGFVGLMAVSAFEALRNRGE